MKAHSLIFLVVTVFSCSEVDKNIFISDSFVNLNEQTAQTIVKNSTPDTLKLSGTFFNFRPTGRIHLLVICNRHLNAYR
jgi:hypothetical protein